MPMLPRSRGEAASGSRRPGPSVRAAAPAGLALLLLLLPGFLLGCSREKSGAEKAAAPEAASGSAAPRRAAPGPAPRGRRAELPDPGLVARARARMDGGGEEGRCGPYRLWSDVRSAELLTLCGQIGLAVEPAYRQRFGLEPVGRPAEGLLLFRDRRAFQRFAREDADTAIGYAGLALPTRGLLALHADRLTPDELAANLAHELTHLVNRRALGPNLPPWLSEGMADAVGDTATAAGLGPLSDYRGVKGLAVRLRGGYQTGRAGSLQRLFDLRRGEFDRDPVSYDYEQSALLVRYLLADPVRAGRFRDYLAALAGGGIYEGAAVPASLGTTFEEMEAGFRGWLVGVR